MQERLQEYWQRKVRHNTETLLRMLHSQLTKTLITVSLRLPGYQNNLAFDSPYDYNLNHRINLLRFYKLVYGY